jgi:putative membrane protein
MRHKDLDMKTASTVLAISYLSCLTPALASGPTDAQIASIVVTANQVDIDAGKYAATRARKGEVRAFAQQMVVDHGGVNRQASALVTKLKVSPENNPTSQALAKGGADNLMNLKALKGNALDKAYVDHEVAYHEQVIEAIDKTLIPSAQNPELKSLLTTVRPAFVAHLEHARKIQSTLR